MLRKETHVFAKKVFYKFIFNLTCCLQQNFHENIYYTLQNYFKIPDSGTASCTFLL